MKAIVYDSYGPPEVLKVREVPKPIPGPRDLLIRVKAATVTSGDCNIRGFTYVPPGFGLIPRLMFGFKKPRKSILGTELSGIVEETGTSVSLFKPGDEVFGIGSAYLGAYAEYVCRPESSALIHKPATLTHEAAASLSFGGLTALYFLKKAKIKTGESVLVRGASGNVGLSMVQLARHFGARVTGVCSAGKSALVQLSGADNVLDYNDPDYKNQLEKYDIIVDTVVGQNSFCDMRKLLNHGGRYCPVAGGPREMLQMMLTSLAGNKKVFFGSPQERKAELHLLADMTSKGQLQVFIDKTFPLEETALAHKYFESGKKTGQVVIKVS